MSNHKAYLDLIYAESNQEEINIFFHGYTAIRSQKQYDTLVYHILKSKPRGRVYLFAWKSGNFTVPVLSNAVKVINWLLKMRRIHPLWFLVDVVYQISHFKRFEKRAEQYGDEFKRHLASVPYAKGFPINFIAHSLGARLTFYALAHNDWSKYHIQDVIWLGSAADVESPDWPAFFDSIGGHLYNLWSEKDIALEFTPDFRSRAGLQKLPLASAKLRNKETALAHKQYWLKLYELLPQYWDNYIPGWLDD